MSKFLVQWEIDIETDNDSPVDAAIEAVIIQRDTDSEALCFTVKNQKTGEETFVDLMIESEEFKVVGD
jgi:hypothetical protein